MTQQEFLINFLCFVDKNFHIKNDADMVAAYLEQHNKEYFEVEHIRKDALEISKFVDDGLTDPSQEYPAEWEVSNAS